MDTSTPQRYAAWSRNWFQPMVLAAMLAFSAPVARSGALEDYVQRPDPAYSWSLFHEEGGLLARYYFLRLTSQRWLDETQVDRPLWVHELRAALPRALFCGDSARTSKTAVLIISGGRNKPEAEFSRSPSTLSGVVARSFCRPVFELRQVPNQPLLFAGETATRKEDGVIAYSFDRFLRESPGDWPVQLAMVKSAVQAMNAIQEFTRQRGDIVDIEDFVVIGASKRGWTAWLTAAVDPRVRAVIPVSIDMLNLPQQFPQHFGCYGDYAPALADYKAFDIACRVNSRRGAELLQVVDPYAYRARLMLPKLVLNSAGDEFFVSDSWRFYFNGLSGDNQLRYTVNTDHGQGSDRERLGLFQLAALWIDEILAGKTPPQLDWRRERADLLVVTPSATVRKVLLWTADNPSGRDFRLETIGAAWHSRELQPDPDGSYRVRLETPSAGWRAALVEATFGGWLASSQQTYTTGVYVLPEQLPHAGPFCAHLTAAVPH